jgi:acyl carrier protein
MHQQLIAELANWSPTLAGTVQRETPLITSGRLDSAGLFQLLLWIEGQCGHPIDATAIDMASEWDTVDRIVTFVERERTA